MPLKNSKNLKPRGPAASLPRGGLPEVVTPHLLDLIDTTGGPNGPLGLQFIAQSPKEAVGAFGTKDPFAEDQNEVAPGLVYKYRGRVDRHGKVRQFGRGLWTVSRYCASYCRFCFRGRIVGLPVHRIENKKTALGRQGFLKLEQVEEVFEYIKNHPELNEIIVSGGDPFVTPRSYFAHIVEGLSKLQKNRFLDIVRIGTRLPIHNPAAFEDEHFQLVAQLKNPYIMLHVNHPDELTGATLKVLERFRRETTATIMSQTVLLKGVNDKMETLQKLFEKLIQEGVRPYYLFQNDPIPWAQHFTVPFEEARKLWGALRPRLSGLAATVKFTIEAEGSFGKIPLPEGDFWEVDYTEYKDMKKRMVRLPRPGI